MDRQKSEGTERPREEKAPCVFDKKKSVSKRGRKAATDRQKSEGTERPREVKVLCFFLSRKKETVLWGGLLFLW